MLIMWGDMIFNFMLLSAINIFTKKLNVDWKYHYLLNFMEKYSIIQLYVNIIQLLYIFHSLNLC
jgi:hypothetical protein